MAKYFNRTRGPLAVALKTGESTIVPPKGTLIVTPAQDGSASLHAKVRKRLLVRLEEKPVKVSPMPVPVVEEPEEPEEQEVASSEEGPDEGEDDGDDEDGFEDDGLEEAPSMQWTKARLIEFAESLDLDVPSNSTKVEILRAIEEAGR